jgi:hypothetical protein
MKITKITWQLTRQIVQFQPIVCSVEATLDEGDDPNVVSKQVKKAVISSVYSDMPEERDKLIARLVGKEAVPASVAKPKPEAENKVNLNDNLSQTPQF